MVLITFLLIISLFSVWVKAQSLQSSVLQPLVNSIILENQQEGSEKWSLTDPARHREIEGYASLTSVDQGGKIKLFVNTVSPSYAIEVFRMGWYGGRGGRKMMEAIDRPGTRQFIPTIPLSNDLGNLGDWTGLFNLNNPMECDWQDPYVLQIPDDWTSGFYLAKLTANSGKQSYIIFVVKEHRPSDFLFQSSVTTYQAYNNWGSKSLYEWNSRGRQVSKVSFNRPYAISPNPDAAYGVGAGEFLTNIQPPSHTFSAGWEYNMVRWLEKEGYDVTYVTDIDTHADSELLFSHRVFLTVGHDEYWSWSMRQNVEAARDRGTSLGFFSANTCYWQIRFENSKVNGEINRTIVAYKERSVRDPFMQDTITDNDRQVTTRWRQSPVSLPEAALMGVMYQTDPVLADLNFAPTSPDWVLANTGLKPGDTLPGLLGYEVDRMTAASPDGTVAIAHSPYIYRGKTRYADTTVYEAKSGAIVFATGSIQWSWGLDDYNVPQLRPSYRNEATQQVTRNILARLAKREVK
ncbi:MAG: hypothetical protein KME15_06550 [Drouetiella hepatica Uher 2000/2452]|uniref:N,N-dimethylformamidase beta subunit-like C-terminal domain-containing protein n=1 Tax=Drouetiella hepatica Uher 2000/2452 TaxID=904376 RepID=A0A951Q9D5_9CYAN|nr:hypothetical protein [Drouetiella hepatica Uher 2000/2452]